MDLSSRRLAADYDLVMNYTRVCGVRAQWRGTRHGRSSCAHNREYFSVRGDIDSIDTFKSFVSHSHHYAFGAAEP